jgi:dipeptidyl-peptidase-4
MPTPLAVTALILALTPLAAQKKPVTIEAVVSQPAALRFEPYWSPDGKRFAYRESGKLYLYDVAARRATEILTWKALEDAATPVPEPTAFDWENRRVTEQPVQWASDSRTLLALAAGDVFLVNLDARGWTQITASAVAERDPKLSPDGRKLAYRVHHDLYVRELDGEKRTRRLTHDGSDTLLNGELDWVYPEELELGTAYWWSPDSKQIAYLQLDTSRELIHPHVDMLGLYARAEPQRYPKAGTPNPDVRLGIVPASGGRTRWMDLGELRERLLARVYWQPDSASVWALRLNRVQNEMHLMAADVATGVSRIVLEEKDPYWINLSDDFQWLPKRRQFLWSSERVEGFRHLYVYDWDGRQQARLTSGDWEVSEVAHVDESGSRVFFLSTEASPLERHLYSVSLSGGERRKLTNERGTHATSISPSAEYWLDTYSGITEPPRTTLRGAAGNAVAMVREPNRKPTEEYDLRPTEFLTFRAANTLFHARLIKPAGFTPARKYPAIVMIYGGPHAQTVRDQWAGLTWEQALAHRGFVIWQMDNRGSAGRGHGWESQVARHFGKLELEDQKEGVKHLISLGFVDPARIGITGWSYGGYMTLTAMLHAPEVFKAGVSGAPVTDWRNYDTIYTERYMGLPSENPEGYRASSPVHFAGNLKGKLMLVHNYGDDNVLYQHNMQMQVELQKAGKLYETLIYPQKAHGVTGVALVRHMREAMTDFFERALK